MPSYISVDKVIHIFEPRIDSSSNPASPLLSLLIILLEAWLEIITVCSAGKAYVDGFTVFLKWPSVIFTYVCAYHQSRFLKVLCTSSVAMLVKSPVTCLIQISCGGPEFCIVNTSQGVPRARWFLRTIDSIKRWSKAKKPPAPRVTYRFYSEGLPLCGQFRGSFSGVHFFPSTVPFFPEFLFQTSVQRLIDELAHERRT